jgi:hypothetical protein
MALEILKQMGLGPYVTADFEANSITFKVQNGPIKEIGENGCQIDMLIYLALVVIRDLNHQFPCRENSIAITKLEEALHWLNARKKDREGRGVEGYNKE